MDFELLVVRGRSATEALKLAEGVTTVGRQDDCQIRIKSSQVSRKHCEFFEKKGLLLVKDLGSSNGTLVNGKRVKGQQVLEPGDELTIGKVTLRVAKIGVAPPVKAAAPASAGAKPGAGDTAVVAAVSGKATADDDFDIDFDDLPAAGTSAEIDEEVMPDEDGFSIPIDDAPPPPKKTAAPAPAAKAAKDAPAPAPPKAKEPEPVAAEGADEAIADFLLDLKLDDD